MGQSAGSFSLVTKPAMSTPPPQDVTQLLSAMAAGDAHASDELLPLVYDELRRLARSQMARESAGLTLQPTALVHEAYLRLVRSEGGRDPKWEGRGHFFASAALAMRRILVERARGHARLKRGGDRAREALHDGIAAVESDDVDLLALDEALKRLEVHNPRASQVVMLRYFAGLDIDTAAAAMNLGPTTIKAEWNYAKAWLHREMGGPAQARGARA
jgi:RNA polymerase sigma factor (TIGR02999 family)